MNETKFYLDPEDQSRFQPLYINTGNLKGFTYELNELSYKKNNEAYFGGEGLVSTLNDYANFCKMLLNNGFYNGKRIKILEARISPDNEHSPEIQDINNQSRLDRRPGEIIMINKKTGIKIMTNDFPIQIKCALDHA